MTKAKQSGNMTGDEELLYLPLGGCGEIGMNLNLYGYGSADGHRWLMVDCGITFGNDTLPGVDIIVPDPSFIQERRDRLDGLVISHAHEDHLGAVPHLWRRFRCPIYATPFAATILRRKLDEVGLGREAKITEIPLGGRFKVGAFEVELVTVTHSIPEPNSIVIRTPLGTVLHSGDWKFDPTPVVGSTADEDKLEALGDRGVLAMICDSTNVFNDAPPRSEGELFDSLTELVGRYKQRVAVSCFSTNVARLDTLARVAAACDRTPVLAGRSLVRIEEAARSVGYLKDIPPFAHEEDAGFIPDEKLMLICTGSQGEPRAALARIAKDEHPNVTLKRGDVVIFSSREIPGNEIAIGRIQNLLAQRGIEIITSRDHFIHVTGHPGRQELLHMYDLVRPAIAVPQHGEARHLLEHAELARSNGVKHVVVAEDGAMVRLAPGVPAVVDNVPVGRLTNEGNRLVPLDGDIQRDRKKAIYNGLAVATVVVDSNGRLIADPQLTSHGLVDSQTDSDLDDVVVQAVRKAIENLPRKSLFDDNAVREAARLAVRRTFRKTIDKRPVTQIHLVRF